MTNHNDSTRHFLEELATYIMTKVYINIYRSPENSRKRDEFDALNYINVSRYIKDIK